MKPVKTAVIGCGAISDIYLSNMINKYATLDVVACCASHRENAEKKAAQYGIRPASTDEILADPEVELVVVLTPAPSHYELVKKALLAGQARLYRKAHRHGTLAGEGAGFPGEREGASAGRGAGDLPGQPPSDRAQGAG